MTGQKTLRLCTLLAALSGLGTALPISVNGRPVPGNSVTVNGQVYVPVSALSAAGFTVNVAGGLVSLNTTTPAPVSKIPGGSNQLTALEGCLNQTLFNGVWRVKFSNLRLASVDGTLKWNIDLEVRNGTKEMMSGADGALMADGRHLSFITADGTPLAWGTYDELAGQKFTFANLPPAGIWKGTLTNVDNGNASQSRPPTKLLWMIKTDDQRQSLKLPWGTKDPSFRVDLTCSK